MHAAWRCQLQSHDVRQAECARGKLSGQAQVRCVRTYNTKPASASSAAPQSPPRLVWVGNKALILMFSDGSECRYSV